MKFALIGKSLRHSFSQAYFQDKFLKLGLDSCTYDNLEFETEEDLIRAFPMIKTKYQGVNITIPYKKALIPYLDHLDSDAEEIGAINCVHFKDHSSFGYNTDYLGFKDSLVKYSDNSFENILLIGNGGASQAVQYCFRKFYLSKITILDRKNQDKWKDNDLSSFQAVINCTPIGMYPNINEGPELNYSSINNSILVIDLIYNPEKTKFLAQAEAFGAQIMNGLPMLENQAALSWDIWMSKG